MLGYYETDKQSGGLMYDVVRAMKKIALLRTEIGISNEKILTQFKGLAVLLSKKLNECKMGTLGNDRHYNDPENGVLGYNIKVPPLTGKMLELLTAAACNVTDTVIAKNTDDIVQEAVSSSILSGYYEACLRPVSDFQANKCPNEYKEYENLIDSVEVIGRSGGHLVVTVFLTQDSIQEAIYNLEHCCDDIRDFDEATSEASEIIETFDAISKLDDKIVKTIKHCTHVGLLSYLESLKRAGDFILDGQPQGQCDREETGNFLLGELRKANS